MLNASIEAEIRDEVSREMQLKMKEMQEDYAKRFQEQVSSYPSVLVSDMTKLCADGCGRDENRSKTGYPLSYGCYHRRG
jgi:hypothetical protein